VLNVILGNRIVLWGMGPVANHEQEALVKRLKEAGISLRRFLKVGKDKAAFELEWQKHLYTPEEMEGYPRWGICGRDGLVLIDVDNSEMAAIIRRILPETFEVISPRRKLPHFYYKVEGGVVDNKTLHCEGDTKGAGEIRAQNHYVVAPGTEIKYIDLASGEEKTGKYTILKDRPIAKISWADFMNVVAPYLGADVNQKITWEQMREGVPQGTRHAQGIKYATFLVGALGLDPETALAQMKDWNKKNRPPMNERDLERMVENAIGYVARNLKKEEPVKKTEKTRSYYFIDGKFVPKILADDIMKDYIFKTMSDTEDVYVYNNGVYTNDGINVIKRECEVRLGGDVSTHRVNEVIGHIQRSTYVERNEFDSDVFVLVLNNGLLNINGGEMTAHTPEYLSTIRLPVDYNPDADCPKIKKFFSEIVKEDDVPVLEELIGYCLFKGYPIHKAFMLVGEGANGKSTFLNLLRTFLGGENVVSVALQDLDRNRFASGALHGKLANIYPDLSPNALYATGKFKMLTGGDLIGAEKKFGGMFTFENYAKLIFSANRIPMVDKDDSMAFFRRWLIINFPNTFNGATANKNLLDKLTTPEELSGLLNLAIKGLKRLMDNGGFSDDRSVAQIREQYIRMSDSVHAFVLDKIEVSPEDFVEKKELYGAYCEYCRNENLPVISDQTFFKRLCQHVRIEEYRPFMGDKRVRALRGLRLSDVEVEKTREVDLESYVQGVRDVRLFSSSKAYTGHMDKKYRKKVDMLDRADTNDKKQPKIPQDQIVQHIKEIWDEIHSQPRHRKYDFKMMVNRVSKNLGVEKQRVKDTLTNLINQGTIPILIPEDKPKTKEES